MSMIHWSYSNLTVLFPPHRFYNMRLYYPYMVGEECLRLEELMVADHRDKRLAELTQTVDLFPL